MTARKLVVPTALACIAVTAFSDVTYTGSAGGDLSDPANWSSPPSASEMGTIDLGTSSGAFTVGSGLALKGIVFSGAAEKSVSISGAGTLSLGEGGLSFDGDAAMFTLSSPVALTAPQTWSLRGTPTDFRAPVEGEDDWTVDASNVVRIYRLGYGGFVTYTGTGGQIRFLGGTDWAEKVRISTTGDSVLSVTNTVEWSDIITGGRMELANNPANEKNNGRLFICQPSEADAGHTGQPGRLIFRDGDFLGCVEEFQSRGFILYIAQGVLDQRGGEIVGSDRHQPAVGGVSVTRTYNGIMSTFARYEISGGTYDASFLSMGSGGKTPDTGENIMVKQTGGTVNAKVGLWMTQNGYTKGAQGLNEYILGGGVLNVGEERNYGGWENSQTKCLVLAGSHVANAAAAKTIPASVFTITGGVLNARSVRFGVDELANQGYINDYAFGMFDMRGGSVPLRSAINGSTTMTGGFDFGRFWPGEENGSSSYRINLSGGRMSVESGDWTNRFGFFFPGLPGGSFVWDTGDGDTLFAAPISGSGTLRKEGSGKLEITDGSCFDGTLDVAEGVVMLTSAFSADDDITGDCYRWTADSLLGTVPDGGTVESWTDVNHGLAAVTNTRSGTSAEGFQLPALTASSDSFNGHAALVFGGKDLSGASLAVEDNPLEGSTECTIVAVFRRTDANLLDVQHLYASRAVCGVGGTWGGVALRMGEHVPVQGAPSYPYAYLGQMNGTATVWTNEHCVVSNRLTSAVGEDAPCHVMMATLDNGRFSVFSDGQYDERSAEYWTPSTAISKGLQFFFGGFSADGAGLVRGALEIAEVRVYPSKALTLAEQRRLGTHLFAKYRGLSAAERLIDLWHGPYYGALGGETVSADARPEGGTAWDAEALAALDAPEGCGKPALVEGTFGGRSSVRFDGASALSIPSSASPLSGAETFSMAVVFRTVEDAATGSDTNRYGHVGLLTTRQTAAYSSDTVLGLFKECSIGVECGNPGTGWRCRRIERRPCRLNDGNAHVAVVSVDPTATTSYAFMVDGHYNESDATAAMGNDVWPAGQKLIDADVHIGVQEPWEKAGFFKGDIAEIVLYDRKLTKDEMSALSADMAAKYRFRLLPKRDFADDAVTARGLRASNIEVREGAVLKLPLSETDPFTLAPGATLSGAGTMQGSYRFTEGATLDLASGAPASIIDVRMGEGGVIRVDADNPYAFENFSASGTVVVDIVGSDEATAPSKITLFSFQNAPSIAPGTIWKFPGRRVSEMRMIDGSLVMCRDRGLVINFR